MRHLVLCLAITALPAVALAEAPGSSEIRTEVFEDELVAGDLVRSDLDVIGGRRARPHRSLIRVREHFHPEMLGTVEDL